MRTLLRAAGALSVTIGLAHLGVAWISYGRLSYDSLWFAGSGLAVVLIGALTVLAGSARSWAALACAALVANLGGLALAIAFGVLSRWGQPQGPLLTAVFAIGCTGCVLKLAKRDRD